MFEGHQFIKLINDNWVLDITEYIGYKVKLGNNKEAIGYTEAFSVSVVNNEVYFNKYIRVPVKVLREAANIVAKHQKGFKEYGKY